MQFTHSIQPSLNNCGLTNAAMISEIEIELSLLLIGVSNYKISVDFIRQ